MVSVAQQSSTADGVAWGLDDLYSSVDDPRITLDLDEALRRAQAFESTYRGKINVGGGPAAEFLFAALKELEDLFEQMDRPAVYAGLIHAAKTDDPRHGALLSRTREQRTLINKHLIFFDLEWVKLPDEAARDILRVACGFVRAATCPSPPRRTPRAPRRLSRPSGRRACRENARPRRWSISTRAPASPPCAVHQ